MLNWIFSHNLIFPFPKLGKMGYCCFVHSRHKTLQAIGHKKCHENMTCLPEHWKPKAVNLIHSYYYNSCMIPLNLTSQQIIRQENMNVNFYFSLIFKLKMLFGSIHVQNLYKSIHKMNGPNLGRGLLVFFACFEKNATTPNKPFNTWWPWTLYQLVFIWKQKLVSFWCTQRYGWRK